MSPISRAVLRAQVAAGTFTLAIMAAVQFGPPVFAPTVAVAFVANTWLMWWTVRAAETDQRQGVDR